MKVFNICCRNGHLFEGWFDDQDDFERQRGRGLVACPVCDDTEVERRPAACHIAGCADSEERLREARERFMRAVRRAAEGAADVGEDFVDEVRAMHRGRKPHRLVRGRCSLGQAEELAEEGIAVLPVPESAGKTLN
ncbi:MAG: DUF1178 family protein [Duodenibacillus sp.]|nr:DUF1178 family protein [Duodenibacillus sp.]